MAETIKYYGTGRRKRAIAKVWIKTGTGKILVNGRDCESYFPSPNLLRLFRRPLEATKTEKLFDVDAKVLGGGVAGQADALRHGIARALLESNSTFKKALRGGGFLTRDSRERERKKYGQKGARKRFQFSKR
ncbi:MAG: 30S ribosomal protein S9 [Chlamydiae bacterium]|nr:30S ribosomal protein S9 [Chlamydiota bacterium]MBI3265806.1 30S ribosomal protein S9 [Chlamydiota bacterium]